MTRASRSLQNLVTVASLSLLGSAALAQQEGVFDRTPRDCISVISIDSTEAVDDQNIIFRMRGNTVYRNHLPQRCPNLERENRISYQVRSGRLCSIDTITVLEQFGGIGLQPGFTCRLGEFVPLSPEEVEDLKHGTEDLPQTVIETESIELERPAAPAEDAAPAESAPVDAEPAAPND
jgi:hypothetical protein